MYLNPEKGAIIENTFRGRYEDKQRFTKTGSPDHESPRELERQSETQSMLAPQNEVNVCRHKCNLKKSLLLIAQDTQQKLWVTV